MYTALQKLGLQPYHMVEAIRDAKRELPLACEALDARGTEKSFVREDFDKWIGVYDAVCDVPMCLLTRELIEAYPDAKVVLTTRDPAEWRKSIEESVLTIGRWRVWSYLALVSADCNAFVKMQDKWNEVMDGWSIEAFNQHNEGVRKVVPESRLLEFKLGKHGWKELCEFVDLPQPEGCFPHVNDSTMYITGHVLLANTWAVLALKDAAFRLAPFIALIGSLWYAGNNGYLW